MTILLISESMYGESQRFINKFLNPKASFQKIVTINAHINQSRLVEMLESPRLNDLQIIDFEGNDLDDEFCNQFWRINFEDVGFLMLSHNSITSEGLRKMNKIKMTSLIQLDLSYNDIGDEGISFLVQNTFPNLKYLDLKGNAFTAKGLRELNKLKAPNLEAIDLSNNNLSFEDFKKLSLASLKSVNTVLAYPKMKNSEASDL